MCSTPYGNQRKITGTDINGCHREDGCSTPYGNQRKITNPCSARTRGTGECSTPYGNQRKITPSRHGLGVALVAVLNALRQSEENHSTSKPSRIAVDLRCSTPYGNQRKITPNQAPSPSGLPECSTPYGNQRKITQRLRRRHSWAQLRCSTPYGNQRKITRLWSHQMSHLSSAQRLTAIRGKSHRITAIAALIEQVLNALRQSEENHAGGTH